jgi:hypothetical protein
VALVREDGLLVLGVANTSLYIHVCVVRREHCADTAAEVGAEASKNMAVMISMAKRLNGVRESRGGIMDDGNKESRCFTVMRITLNISKFRSTAELGILVARFWSDD